MLTKEQKATLVRALESEALDVLALDRARQMASELDVPLRCIEWFALDQGMTVPRYQPNVLTLGRSGQKRLLQSAAMIVGLGGLGGYVLEELARAGVGKIFCVDRDTFDETNLNRQLLATCSTLGASKASQARQRGKEINEAVEVVAVTGALAEVPPELWQDVDIAFDCLDNIPDRRALAETCSAGRIPLVHGAVGAWCGQVGVIWPGSGALERLYRNCRDVQRTGVLPCTAATAASLMVSDGMKVLVDNRNDGELRLLFFDLLENEWHSITFGNDGPGASFEHQEERS